MIRPVSDCLIVDLDPLPEKVGDIIIPDADKVPLRTGTVVAVGPGKRHSKTDRLTPTMVKAGERVCIHHAVVRGSKQSREIFYMLEGNLALCRENDILFIIDEGEVGVGL